MEFAAAADDRTLDNLGRSATRTDGGIPALSTTNARMLRDASPADPRHNMEMVRLNQRGQAGRDVDFNQDRRREASQSGASLLSAAHRSALGEEPERQRDQSGRVPS